MGMHRFVRMSLVFGVAFLAIVVLATFNGREAFSQARPALTRDVDEPGRSPYVIPVGFALSDGENFKNQSFNDLVPVGYRFVLETITGAGVGPSGQLVRVQLHISINTAQQPYNDYYMDCAQTPIPSEPGGQRWMVHQVTRAYVDRVGNADNNKMMLTRFDTTGSVFYSFWLVGHLVSLP